MNASRRRPLIRAALALLLLLAAALPLCAAPSTQTVPPREPAAVAPPHPEASTTTATLRPLTDPEAARILREVYDRVQRLRGIEQPQPVPSYAFESSALRALLADVIEEQMPRERRLASEAFLKSLQLVPDDLDMLEMYMNFLDQQAAGLYDERKKRLYVNSDFDIARSEVARLILAHEICHALQDHAYDFKALGLNAENDDDRAIAISTLAEGDAMVLMADYALRHGSSEVIREIPALLMGSSAGMEDIPHFFQQVLFFPYLQGQIFVQYAISLGPEWRRRIFTDPPRTTEQIIHHEKYFDSRDHPTTLVLAAAPGQTPPAHGAFRVPSPPAGYDLAETNNLGELGTRLVFEEKLGAGIANDAAQGWDGDLYVVYRGPGGRWWFCWESAWDSERDASEFVGAWITLWRHNTGDRRLGDLTAPDQEFRAGPWTVRLHRVGPRVVTSWGN